MSPLGHPSDYKTPRYIVFLPISLFFFNEMRLNQHLVWKGATACSYLFIFFPQRELQQVAQLWNCHRIRPSRNAVSPSGRPLLMHSIPQLFGSTDHLKAVHPQQVQLCREECLPRGPFPCEETVFDICCLIMSENHLHPPTTAEEVMELYLFLRAHIYTLL